MKYDRFHSEKFYLNFQSKQSIDTSILLCWMASHSGINLSHVGLEILTESHFLTWFLYQVAVTTQQYCK